MDEAWAQEFAAEWIAAWNAHDLDRVLAHYTDDFVMTSPKIRQIAGEPSGTLRGKPAVRAYWAQALQLLPDLRFELLTTLVGAKSITLYYRGARGQLAAEVFHLGEDGRVARADAHYRTETPKLPVTH